MILLLNFSNRTVMFRRHSLRFIDESLQAVSSCGVVQWCRVSGLVVLLLILNGRKIIKIKKNIINYDRNKKVVEFLGLVKFSRKGASLLLKKLQYLNKNHKGKFHTADSFKKAYLIDMIQELINSDIDVSPVFVSGKYFEMDTPEDIRNAEKSIKKF